eukprot:PhF_6_TR7897/c0_g5_i1/m.11655
MVALAKKAQPKDWNDYRGITLLEVASKVLTNIILARMAIPMLDAQFGFRRARSTRQAVALAKHVLSSAKSAKCPAVAVFIDSEKAYDSLRHVVLWDTLRRAGVGEATIALLQDLYNGETRVKMVNTMAPPFRATRGVRQGCLLSPMLFNLCLDRALRAARPNMDGLDLIRSDGRRLQVTVLGYADDLVVFAPTREQAQKNVNALTDELIKLGLKVNADKTKWMEMRVTPDKTKGRAGAHEDDEETGQPASQTPTQEAAPATTAPTAPQIVQRNKREYIHWTGQGTQLCPMDGCGVDTPPRPRRPCTNTSGTHTDGR